MGARKQTPRLSQLHLRMSPLMLPRRLADPTGTRPPPAASAPRRGKISETTDRPANLLKAPLRS
eukprot:5468356-Pyramimonas_sp.AAC.1